MIDKLYLLNFRNDSPVPTCTDGTFILKTCQRTLFLNIDTFPHSPKFHPVEQLEGKEAYKYLLEVICGIKSRVLAESEIVSQFKQAYKTYIQQEKKCTKVLRILEKLLKDAKEIRTEYLIGVGQKTYAAISRKILAAHGTPDKVLIIGSGQLSQDVINQLKKRVNHIYITGRNKNKVEALCDEHQIKSVEWRDNQTYIGFPKVINTIGVENVTVFASDFFTPWSDSHKENSLFIDLGSPSIIDTALDASRGVYRLEDIFKKSVIKEAEKVEKIKQARTAIAGLAEHRRNCFKKARQGGVQLV